MFRGGRVDSRGTGITSGLGYAKGGSVNTPKRGLVDEPGRYSQDLRGIFVNKPRVSKPTVEPGRWGRFKNWIKGTPSWLSGAGPELSAARNIPWGTTASYVGGAFAPTGIMAYLNRPKTAAEKKIMQDYGSVDETWTEDDYARYDADRQRARKEGEEISFMDAIFMDPESGTYPKIFGRYEDVEKRRIAEEKAKKIAEEGGNLDKELTKEEKDILGLKDTIKTLQAQLEDALKPKKSTEEEDLAKIEKQKKMFEKVYGSGRGEDATNMLLSFAGKALKPGADTKSAFGEFFEAEAGRPSTRKKYLDAAAQAAIQAFLAGETSYNKFKDELELYKDKIDIQTRGAKAVEKDKSFATIRSESRETSNTKKNRDSAQKWLDNNEINKFVNETNSKKVPTEELFVEENIGEYFIDQQTGEFFLIDTLENGEIGKIRKG